MRRGRGGRVGGAGGGAGPGGVRDSGAGRAGREVLLRAAVASRPPWGGFPSRRHAPSCAGPGRAGRECPRPRRWVCGRRWERRGPGAGGGLERAASIALPAAFPAPRGASSGAAGSPDRCHSAGQGRCRCAALLLLLLFVFGPFFSPSPLFFLLFFFLSFLAHLPFSPPSLLFTPLSPFSPSPPPPFFFLPSFLLSVCLPSFLYRHSSHRGAQGRLLASGCWIEASTRSRGHWMLLRCCSPRVWWFGFVLFFSVKLSKTGKAQKAVNSFL